MEVSYHMLKIVLIEVHFSIAAFGLNIDCQDSGILFRVSVKSISQ
jgi:hypothetical protein